ncbi:MAG TPA: FtsX-like permease family protein [Actinomycetota bacterium]|nr:FtsX-like permease family protein [Actinomycetota bacterium]
MRAVWLRARAEIRSRRRALLSATLICGLAGAAVLATLAGARRTESVYPRFLETHLAEDLVLNDLSFFVPVFWKPDFEALVELPYVESAAQVEFVGLGGELDNDLPEGGLSIGSRDPNFTRTIHKPLMMEGRLPDPAKAEEIAVPYFAEGDLAGFRLGDQKRIQIGEEIVAAKVVGRHVFPGELPPEPNFGFAILVTPAFLERYGDQREFGFTGIMIRFNDRSDAIRFQNDVRELAGGKLVQPQWQDSHSRAVQSSARLQASALRLLALFIALTGALIVGQLLARETSIAAEDAAILRALGLDRRQRFTLGIIRVAPVAFGGALLALLAAWLASPLFPRGTVRTITPSIAPTFDASILAVGALVIAAAVVILIIPSGWRAANAAGRIAEVQEQPSRIASLVSALGASIPAVTGARLALERGHGRSAVPVYSSMSVVALGIAAFVAASIFANSLKFMIDRPELYGVSWDGVITTWIAAEPPEDDSVPRATAGALVNDPDIEALAFADTGIPLRLYSERGPEFGIPVGGMAVFKLKGSVFPPVIEGREPEAPNEVVLGTRMMRELGVTFDPLRPPSVEISLQGNEDPTNRVSLRVVGRAVIPPLSNFGELGYGVALTSEEALIPLLAGGDRPPVVTDLLVRWRPGAKPAEVLARYQDRFPNLAEGDELATGEFADAVSFGGVQGAPLIVGGVLAALGAAALAHVLVTAIRRRRRDVAILKAVGFVRGQARRMVAWQSTFTVVVATAIGVPLGVIGGRFIWSRVADNLGVLPQPRVSMVLIGIMIPAVVVLANLIAALPARSAARTQPALVLRSE